MADGTFVNAMTAAVARPVVHVVNGRETLVVPNGWQQSEVLARRSTPVTVHTLTGFRDFVAANIDEIPLGKTFVHVVDESRVHLVAELEGEDVQFRRAIYLTAAFDSEGFPFGKYVDVETFIVGLMTQFAPTPEREQLLVLLGSIKESDVRETFDDGLAQEVKVARGIALVGNAKVPSPIVLQPYRTFREIAPQPASLFVVRLRGGSEDEKPRVALFEADGGVWRLEAVALIAAWFREEFAGDSLRPLVVA